MIDTIVVEVQSVPEEDRCVFLLGYKEQMNAMFQNVKPSLSRRFAIDDPFHFQDLTSLQLRQILKLKLKVQELETFEEANNVVIEVLVDVPNFGNAGEVENTPRNTRTQCQTRQSGILFSQRVFDVGFEPQGFDMNFYHGENASMDCRERFTGVIGCCQIKRVSINCSHNEGF